MESIQVKFFPIPRAYKSLPTAAMDYIRPNQEWNIFKVEKLIIALDFIINAVIVAYMVWGPSTYLDDVADESIKYFVQRNHVVVDDRTEMKAFARQWITVSAPIFMVVYFMIVANTLREGYYSTLIYTSFVAISALQFFFSQFTDMAQFFPLYYLPYHLLMTACAIDYCRHVELLHQIRKAEQFPRPDYV